MGTISMRRRKGLRHRKKSATMADVAPREAKRSRGWPIFGAGRYTDLLPERPTLLDG